MIHAPTVCTGKAGPPQRRRRRRARLAAHAAFDPLWRSGTLSKTEAYAWLVQVMGKPDALCHMRYMSIKECRKVVQVCTQVQGLSARELRKVGNQMSRQNAKEPRWKLYWATTPDHDEDWFIVARNKREAKHFHEQAEGYDTSGGTDAELVCPVPVKLQAEARLGWPSHELIERCGGEFVSGTPITDLHRQMGCGQRVVKFGDSLYREGDIVANAQKTAVKGLRH